MKYNFLDHLISMSIYFRTYKEVGRDYIDSLFEEVNEVCESDFCTNCSNSKDIRFELVKKGFDTFNKHAKCWRINHHWDNITVEPIHDENTDKDSKTD